MSINFSNTTGEMKVKYSSRTTDKMPDKFIIIINGEEQIIKDNDFLIAVTSVELNEGKLTKHNLEKGSVVYEVNEDVKNLLDEGNNEIEISFSVSRLGGENSKEEYTILNTVVKNGDSLEFVQESFEFEL